MSLDHYAMRSLDDWRFYFQRAGAAMGIKAIDYERRLSMLGTGAHPSSIVPQERHLAAARRHANIEARLAWLTSHDLRLVRMACDDEPRELWVPFGSGGLGNLALESRRAWRAKEASRSTRELDGWLDKMGARILRGRATAEEHQLRGKIAEEIEQLVDEVHTRYSEAWRASA